MSGDEAEKELERVTRIQSKFRSRLEEDVAALRAAEADAAAAPHLADVLRFSVTRKAALRAREEALWARLADGGWREEL